MEFFEKPGVLLVILLVLLLFGAKRLPDLARGLGRSARILKSETEGLRGEDKTGAAAPTEAVAAAPAAPAAPAVAPPPPAAPVTSESPRYLVDPVTGEQVLAQPVVPPADGANRA
jgi:sec-independent protein translocase protein TatA